VGLTAAGTRARRARAGFTLVEVLVAVAIVAIASAAAFLAWRGGDAGALRREAQHLAGAVEYAAERAQWRREPLGLTVDATGYRFWQRDVERGAWIPAAGDDALAARAWPAGLTLVSAAHAGRPLGPATLVAFRPNGRNDPLSFVLASGEARVRVDADPLNRASVADAP
jgi:general secretion pathway protein H